MGSSSIEPSAITNRILKTGAKSSSEALPLEVLHNLQFQHKWTDLTLHSLSLSRKLAPFDLSTSNSISVPSGEETVVIISGLPPRHSYIHPDFLSHLVQHGIEESSIPIQREIVLPTSIGQTWTLQRFATVFDSLQDRDPVEGAAGFKHQDSKRILLGMLGHNGMGGDGTIVYYIMQEGEVKPRQN